MKAPDDKDYWEGRFREGSTAWDIGYASPALVEYAEGFPRDTRILIPGCGHAYEGGALHHEGYSRLHLLDLAPSALKAFRERVPDFPENRIHEEDFFEHHGSYGLILEQTFFCAIGREERSAYVEKCFELLIPGGHLAGLLWAEDWEGGPPYGGTQEEYEQLFGERFHILKMEPARNSIKPRQGKELFFALERP